MARWEGVKAVAAVIASLGGIAAIVAVIMDLRDGDLIRAPRVDPTTTGEVSQAQLASWSTPLGNWEGHWTNATGHKYSFELRIELGPEDSITGSFTWRLLESPRPVEQHKIGSLALEYIEGTYDPMTRNLQFVGSSKDDPHRVIGLASYYLQLSEDGRYLTGSTRFPGSDEGLSATRRP